MTSSNACFQPCIHRDISIQHRYIRREGERDHIFFTLRKSCSNLGMFTPTRCDRLTRWQGAKCIQIRNRWLSLLPHKFHFQNKTNNKVKQNICYALLFKNLLKFKLHIHLGSRCCGYAIFPPIQQVASSCGKFGGISSMTTASNLQLGRVYQVGTNGLVMIQVIQLP